MSNDVPPNTAPDDRAIREALAAAGAADAAIAEVRMEAAAEALPAERKAAYWRAVAVRNMMAIHKSTLVRSDLPPDFATRALAEIDTAWSALARRAVGTENKRRVLDAVDRVAGTAHGR